MAWNAKEDSREVAFGADCNRTQVRQGPLNGATLTNLIRLTEDSRWSRATRIVLQPLTLAQVGQLVRSCLNRNANRSRAAPLSPR